MARALTDGRRWYGPTIDHGRLPDGLGLQRRTDDFDADSVPAGLLRAHRIAEGVWGVLRVTAGSVTFVDERDVAGAVVLSAGDSIVIAPGVAHHVAPAADARFHVEFHR